MPSTPMPTAVKSSAQPPVINGRHRQTPGSNWKKVPFHSVILITSLCHPTSLCYQARILLREREQNGSRRTLFP